MGCPRRGTNALSRPPTLIDEVGPYPAESSIYGLSWPSVERTWATGEAYVAGAKARADATVRLMTELVPDWEVFVVVTGELHSASEAMWHGIDPDHPIHDHPSAPAAKKAMDDAYRAVDDLVGKAVAAAGPDTHVVAFNMGGMGPNAADLPTMLLLPELLYRWSYGSPRLKPRADWADVSAVPILRPDETWERAVLSQLPAIGRDRHLVGFARRLPRPLRDTIHRLRGLRPRNRKPKAATSELKVDWMPAAQYAECWSGMDAFALPAYYQGRVRVNIEGREARAGSRSNVSTPCSTRSRRCSSSAATRGRGRVSSPGSSDDAPRTPWTSRSTTPTSWCRGRGRRPPSNTPTSASSARCRSAARAATPGCTASASWPARGSRSTTTSTARRSTSPRRSPHCPAAATSTAARS